MSGITLAIPLNLVFISSGASRPQSFENESVALCTPPSMQLVDYADDTQARSNIVTSLNGICVDSSKNENTRMTRSVCV